MTIVDEVAVHPEVADALGRGRAVVALESAVITTGLPRTPLPSTSKLRIDGWNASAPVNFELGRMMDAAVREAGAVPATIAILDGALRIGLNDEQLNRLASDSNAGKASITDAAHTLAACGLAGATVSSALAACKLTHPPIRVLATGGIGGAHRGWQKLPDISADLQALASTRVCVVCSGGKSILDLPATLEMLESLGVPVVGYRTQFFPQFYCTGDDSLTLHRRVDDVDAIARLCDLHWRVLKQPSGIVLANPAPPRFALEPAELEGAIESAEQLASSHGIAGPARTPFLLAEIARLTAGRSLDANIALLLENARLAGQIANQIARRLAGTGNARGLT